MGSRAEPWRTRVAAAVIDASPDYASTLISRAMGMAARMRLPPKVGRAAINAYMRYFDVNAHDIDPLALEDGFESFDAFFTRPLRSGARSIDRSARTLVSPCDGELREVVTIERSDTEVVAKGQRFSIGELLADEGLAERFVGGTASTIYLHPRDYHRVHAPCDALAWQVSLVPGRLLPVTAAAVARVPRLFALNERMVHVLETGHGHVAVVMVAAFGVGHMTCSYHRFAPHPRELQLHRCDPPARLRKGDELGVFHLGSTVIVVTEPGMHVVERVTPVTMRLGQPLLEDDAP
ncbi:MAG: phosphatidylserine decarboxylase [Nannocystaceae bacterium]|nr:phosphatidylserine decarboxylase [Deltaproteobacteria bacterium]MBP7291516.1 phosphatidylserine decarboxylase [Nannocystaceae bacterium]